MAKKKNPLFLSIDSLIFKQVAQLKEIPFIIRLRELMAQQEEEKRQMIVNIIIVALIILPLLFSFYLLVGNISIKSALDKREEILIQAAKILEQQALNQQAASNIFAPSPIETADEMNNKISQAASSSFVDTSKITVSDFSLENLSPTIGKATAKLSFKDLTTMQLSNLFQQLISNNKMAISSIEITKDDKSKLLVGNLSILQYNRNSLHKGDEPKGDE